MGVASAAHVCERVVREVVGVISHHRGDCPGDTFVPLGSGVLGEDGECPVRAHALTILAGVRHRVVGVARGDDSGGEWDVVAGDVVGVPGAVDAFVMAADDRGEIVECS